MCIISVTTILTIKRIVANIQKVF